MTKKDTFLETYSGFARGRVAKNRNKILFASIMTMNLDNLDR